MMRGEHPGDHLGEFDDLSDEIKALRTRLAGVEVSLAPSEREGADAAAIAAACFTATPGQRLAQSAASATTRREATDSGRGPATDLGR
jgi:hypothetical protein